MSGTDITNSFASYVTTLEADTADRRASNTGIEPELESIAAAAPPVTQNYGSVEQSMATFPEESSGIEQSYLSSKAYKANDYTVNAVQRPKAIRLSSALKKRCRDVVGGCKVALRRHILKS